MKTLRVSDRAHRELTRLLGEMMAQIGKPQTFSARARASRGKRMYSQNKANQRMKR